MREVIVQASRSYRVLIGSGLIQRAGELSAPLIAGRKALIAAGETVFPLYGDQLRQSLEAAGFQVSVCVYPAGEQAKTPQTLMTLIGCLAEGDFTRGDAVFALGGGVTGDMAGLAAALYQRGMACVQIPTTLLAAVDASVGGKTAVNLPSGKNQMGVFSQPVLVLCDTDCFSSLPPEIYAEGWAEIIKYAFLRRGPLQELLLREDAEAHLEEIIEACVTIKRDLVCADEYDRGERQLLNFGHTVGHAIEACSSYTIYHGAAVAQGMAVVTRGCLARGICDDDCADKLMSLLKRFRLADHCPYGAEELLAAARSDKKRRGERITLVLPKRFGECILKKSDFEELGELIALGL